MRLSHHFGRTLREAPTDATLTSHQLILRAGLARPIGAGIWAYLPMGYRVLKRLEGIIREEMETIGAEEMLMPVLHPADLWEEAGREGGDVLLRLKNREGRPFALAASHEGALVHLCLSEIESYRDLPQAVYHFQATVRDEPHVWGGLLRLRESHVMDAYSLDADEAGLADAYQRCYQAYRSVFERCGLDVVPVEAEDSGSHAFVLPFEEGDDRFVRCDSCEYAASAGAARFERQDALYGDPAEMEKVETPGCHTIADLCAFLKIDPKQTLKLVMYTSSLNQPGEMVIMALVRGDLDVNETKLKRALGISDLQPATEDVISEMGAQAGYASPIGLHVRGEGEPGGIVVVADESLRKMSNFVTGANDEGYHYVNANYPRDFGVTQFADLAEPFDGAACARCGGALRVENALELGRCSRVGTRASQAADATYLDDKGQKQLIVMGAYDIGLDRLLAAIVEKHHDEYGIIWPREAAPYDVHIVAIAKSEDDEAVGVAEKVYADLQAAGLSVLYDDRRLSPGVMFTDADLIGVPLRVTVGARSLEKGGVEVKRRHEKDRDLIPVGELVETIRRMTEG
jgi:prolyl-tRNA synthetase